MGWRGGEDAFGLVGGVVLIDGVEKFDDRIEVETSQSVVLFERGH